MKKKCTHIKMKLGAMLFGAIWVLASCGEIYDLNGFDWEPDLPPSDSVYNREIQILDLGDVNVPEGHRPIDRDDPMYFSLEKFSSVHLGYKVSGRWDIAFHGLYRTYITANNGSIRGLGYGSSAVGGLVVLEQPYSEVTEVPDDSQFQIPGGSGLGFGGNLVGGYIPGGHVYYTGFGALHHPEQERNIYPENLYQHMMYAMSEEFAAKFGNQAKAPKTIIIRTASGNYVKMETQSYYKGVMDPVKMRRGTDNPIPYISFRYMVIKAEEKRFGFVERQPKLTINMSTKKTTVGE